MGLRFFKERGHQDSRRQQSSKETHISSLGYYHRVQFFRSALLLVTAALRVIVQWCRTLGNHKREQMYEDQKRKRSTSMNIRRGKGARVWGSEEKLSGSRASCQRRSCPARPAFRSRRLPPKSGQVIRRTLYMQEGGDLSSADTQTNTPL